MRATLFAPRPWTAPAVVFARSHGNEGDVVRPLAVCCSIGRGVFSFKQAFPSGAAVCGTAGLGILAALLLTGARATRWASLASVPGPTCSTRQNPHRSCADRSAYPLVFAYGEPRVVAVADVLPEAALIVILVLAACWSWWRAHVSVLALGFCRAAPTSSVGPSRPSRGRATHVPAAHDAHPNRRAARRFARRSIGARLSSSRATRMAPRWWRFGAHGLDGCLRAVGGATIQRNTEYATAEGLWRSTLERGHRVATATGESLWQSGMGGEAIEHLRATLTEHPEVRHALGHTLFEQGRFDEALVELRSFLEQTALLAGAEASARLGRLRRSRRSGSGGARPPAGAACPSAGLRAGVFTLADTSFAAVSSLMRRSRTGAI